MKKYMLNALGDCWIFEGNTEKEAEKEYLCQLGLETRKQYDDFCESCGLDATLDFKEIVKK